MSKAEQLEIIEKAKVFALEKIIPSHLKNTSKLGRAKEFDVNPFLVEYLANYAFGDSTPESIARVLVYPRVLGQSISTTFGTMMQQFCNDALSSFASVVVGMDIEFIDQLDNRRKYCQVKSGPKTLNADDVPVIIGHFKDLANIARTNRLTGFNPITDAVVGVLYGTPKTLSGHYKKIAKEYPVYVGEEFWHRLTGVEDFYFTLVEAFASVAKEQDSSEMLEMVVQRLADDIRENGLGLDLPVPENG